MKQIRLFILVLCLCLFARIACAIVPLCAITGTVLKPDSTPCASCTITFTPTGSVPQIISGIPYYPTTVFTTTDGSGVMTAISLIQGANMTVTITDSNGQVSAPVQTGVAMSSGETIAQLLSNNLLSPGVSTVSGLNVGTKTITAASSPYTVLVTDFFIDCDATSGNVIINLPASSGGGRWLHIEKIDSSANTCTVTAAGADTIEGVSSFALKSQFEGNYYTDSELTKWVTGRRVTNLQNKPICTTAPSTTGQKEVYNSTTGEWCPASDLSTGMSFPVQSYNGECNAAGNGQPYPPTTANTTATNTTITVASATGFVTNGGIKIKHAGPINAGAAPAAPTVTAVQLTSAEAHSVTPNTGTATFTTSNNFVEDSALRVSVSGASKWRVNTGATLLRDEYFVTPPVSPPGVGTYSVQTSGMSTSISALKAYYWTPDTSDATSYCYKVVFINAADGVTPASAQACTTTAAAALTKAKGVVVDFGTPPANSVGVGIYKSTDGGNSYQLYWAQPLKDQVGISTVSVGLPLETDKFVDVGPAIGPYFAPFYGPNPPPGKHDYDPTGLPIVDNNYPASPPGAALGDDLDTTIATISGTTLTLAAAPSQTLTGAMAMTIDTKAFADAMTAAKNVGGGFVDIPIGCRLNYLNSNTFPALYSGQTANGITLRGTKSYVTNAGINFTIVGTGNGSCALNDSGSSHGGLQLYFQVNTESLHGSCNDNGSTNFTLGCMYTNGNDQLNGQTRMIDTGNGGGPGPDTANRSNCPNAAIFALSGNSNSLVRPAAVRGRWGIVANGNNNRIVGPGDVGFPYRPKETVVDLYGGVPQELSNLTEELGPNFLNLHGASSGFPCNMRSNYWGDTYRETSIYELGDDIPVEVGIPEFGFQTPTCNFSDNLITFGLNGMVVAGCIGCRIEGNSFYGLASQSINGLVITDGVGSHFTNNRIGFNNFQGGGYSGAGIVDDASNGVDDIYVNWWSYATGNSIDFTNAGDTGWLEYQDSLDGTAGILDPNTKIPKFHRKFGCAGGSAGCTELSQQITMSGPFYDKTITTDTTGGGSFNLNPTLGNTQVVTFADNNAVTLGGTGTPWTKGQRWTLLLDNLLNSGASGTITLTSAYEKEASFPASGLSAKTASLCQAVVAGINQSIIGPCSAAVTPVATPTPTAVPSATPTPTPGPSASPTPTPLPTP